jgi:glutathione peroxidase
VTLLTAPVERPHNAGMTTAHDFHAKTIDGTDKSLADYAGKALLLVNVASKCGLTPQYEKLEALHRKYADRGLVVLGFPCNQFGGQEPGTEAEIQTFCQSKYDVTFPMFSKIDVNGATKHALYAWLESEPTKPEGPGDITWNFAKFLVGKDGRVVARFSPKEDPSGEKVASAIEAALGS